MVNFHSVATSGSQESMSLSEINVSDAKSSEVYVCVHGHFYQPPRENPSLEAVERQPSAAPYHDWNERILKESYRPNAFARIMDHQGQVVKIINNYESISFNIGPTLMSWLARHDIETYRRILEADKRSCDRNNGHGNAIAQVYNHMILPLANERDKITQVRWGIADFRKRFNRDPEGIWLAETAIDQATLRVLIQEGIKFTIVAPSQVKRCRPMVRQGDSPEEWHEVGGGQIDPTRPYRCFVPGLPNGNDYIDIFVYDGPISGDMGFSNLLESSQSFADRLSQAIRGDRQEAQLISVATDGETFGHHRGGAERALAYALNHEFSDRGWHIVSYANYLNLFPPTWELELKPVTAWSCAHGVERWKNDCGCGGGGEWHQKWRAPLRDALDWLRDELTEIYEVTGEELFKDPWAARNSYIDVICDRNPRTIEQFFNQHQHHELTSIERTDALCLLEMQRHAMLMYTSCGWFFEEISRPEGTQILRYAARAIELAEEICGESLEADFIAKLSLAPSNIPQFKNGAGVYHHQVKSAQISIEQVVAHYAMSSLFHHHHREQHLYCNTITHKDYQKQTMGALTLALGQVTVVSEITQVKANYTFAVCHLGGQEFICGIQPFKNRLAYSRAKEAVLQAFGQGSMVHTIDTIQAQFGEHTFNLQQLFSEERQQIMQLLSQNTLHQLKQLYHQVYRENYGVLMTFHREQMDVPRELQVAAEITLSQRIMDVLRQLEQDLSEIDDNILSISTGYLGELEGIAIEANHLRCHLNLPTAATLLENLILQALRQVLRSTPESSPLDCVMAINSTTIQGITRLIHLGTNLGLNLDLSKAQEVYYSYIQNCQSIPNIGNALGIID
ncbi:DUF3536 domain-containing protein [Leptothoe kymatousa]|uniref:DUF3536 domain-containing protein n=1 Tax=Leptothoe kymatousa TAU-MAC 1615 TaxID=2364775 RepID=A0ABS5Y1D3_9CYAN|nr:DUF3536 domain-containing protein [Leptothoe kymatousa]MBT9311637.1 DUF3536 domain-containing protein [Leptothoe kymatousa TAU-MAC 1615]